MGTRREVGIPRPLRTLQIHSHATLGSAEDMEQLEELEFAAVLKDAVSSETKYLLRKHRLADLDEFQGRIVLWMKGYIKRADGTFEEYSKDRHIYGDVSGSAFRNVALVVGRDTTGKTTSYLLALSDMINSSSQDSHYNGSGRDEYRNKVILNRSLRSSQVPSLGDMPKMRGLPKFDWNNLLVPLGIVLVPSREIGMQIFQLCCQLQLRARLIAGGRGYKKQSSFTGGYARVMGTKCIDNVDVVIATPEMLLRTINGAFDDARIDIKFLRYLILEECDMLCEGFYLEQLNDVLNMLHHDHLRSLYITSTKTEQVMNHIRQVHLDGDSEMLGHVSIAHPKSHTVGPEIKQVFTAISQSDPLERLLETLEELNIRGGELQNKTVIFCNTVKCCKFLAHALKERGYNVTSLHGEMGYEQRSETLKNFGGLSNLLVATNLASRGALNQDVHTVISFDFPHNVSDYLHRGSRVAHKGTINTFFSKKHLPVLKNIQRLNTDEHRIEYRNVSARVSRILQLQLQWNAKLVLRNKKLKKGGRKALSLPPRRNILSPINKRAMKRFYLREKAIKKVEFLQKRGMLKKGYGLPKMPDRALEASDSQEFVRMQRSADGFLQVIPKRRSRIRSSSQVEGYDPESQFIEGAPSYEEESRLKPRKHHRNPYF
ncbi:RNA helicase like protein [Babesia gibsoni]|uniref:RNA helicase like protein n=1 Tax=Babesia gibsoni TaxID=33632 RepID=A0AAD8LSM5_BABGI|nr:RNA helicase like protein [Babesia gibsoni]